MSAYYTDKLQTGILSENDIAQHKVAFSIVGILTVIAGGLALVMPHIATITVELIIGALLVVDGVLQLVNYYQLRSNQGFIWRLLGGLLSIVAGVLLLIYPFIGVLSLTLVLGTFFIMAGIFRTFLAFQIKPQSSWSLLLLSAVISLVFGVLILVIWPEAAGWILGLLVGIDMIFAGTWLLTISLFAAAMKKESQLDNS